MLTQKRLLELFHYDPETGVFTRIEAPGKRTDLVGYEAGSAQSGRYLVIAVDGTKYRANRLAWLYMTGEWPSRFVDHWNNVKDDNRWSNLRLATRAQNEQNKPPSRANTSGAKGVYWNKAAKKWQAFIKLGGRARYLGIYVDWFDAVCARKSAERDLFGVFAFGAKQ